MFEKSFGHFFYFLKGLFHCWRIESRVEHSDYIEVTGVFSLNFFEVGVLHRTSDLDLTTNFSLSITDDPLSDRDYHLKVGQNDRHLSVTVSDQVSH